MTLTAGFGFGPEPAFPSLAEKSFRPLQGWCRLGMSQLNTAKQPPREHTSR